jgi:hypothetical protein
VLTYLPYHRVPRLLNGNDSPLAVVCLHILNTQLMLMGHRGTASNRVGRWLLRASWGSGVLLGKAAQLQRVA